MKKRSAFLILIVLAAAQIAHSQSVSTTMGARALGLANAASTLSDDWALFNNVGGLANLKDISGAFSYEARPMLPGAARMSASFTYPTKLGVAGVGLFRFGDNLYSEQILSTAFSNKFGIASLGLKLNYIQYRAEGYGTRSALSLNFGGIAQLTPQLSVGAYLVNINQPKLSTGDHERLPTRLVAGLNYNPIDEVILAMEVEKDIAYPATLKAGGEYRIHTKVFVRTGFNLQPNAAFFGVGVQTWKIKFDYAIQYSNALNFAHQASASYRFEKKPNKIN